MPAASQGSKVPLVAATVVSCIVSVAMAIVAIYFYVSSSKIEEVSATETKALQEVVTKEMIRSQTDDLERLRAAKTDTDRGFDPSMKLFNVALASRNQLAKLIGNDNDAIAYKSGHDLIEKAKATGIKPSDDSLGATVNALLAEVQARKTEAENSRKDSTESQNKLKQTLDATSAQIKSMNAQLDQLRAEKDAAMDQVAAADKKQTGDFESAAAELRKQLDTANDQVTQLNSQNAELGKQIKTQDTLIAKLEEKLGQRRVDPHRQVIQEADGKISLLLNSQYCYINIGSDDQVTRGLTFEVYDAVKGIPATPQDVTGDETVAPGKASIEVVDVDKTLSRCLIRRLAPGETMRLGDPIVNLVYDRNTKYNFVVHGIFDIDQNGTASAQEGDVIRRLVTQWHGNLMTDVNVDTDFVVLGREPVVPETTPDPNDPLAIAAYNSALRAQQEYQDIVAKARAYRLPVLNQNTFLYFVGYYTEAKR